MKIKIILLLTIVFFITACGNSQEPPKKSSDINGTSIHQPIPKPTLKLTPITFQASEDTPLALNKQSFLTATTSNLKPDGIMIVSLPNSNEGILELNGTAISKDSNISLDDIGFIKFTPKANFYGESGFSFKAYHDEIFSDVISVTFTVNAQNDKPVFELVKYEFGFEKRVINSDLNNSRSVLSIDLNHDGKSDILTVSRDNNQIKWFENLGSFNFKEHNITEPLEKVVDIQVADIDGDGDLDIIAGGSGIAVFKNQDLNFTKEIIDTNETYAIFIKDMDGDNDLDIASVDKNGVELYINNNSSFAKTTVDNSLQNPTAIIIADYDKDGKDDLIVSAFNDGLSWYKQEANLSFSKKVIYTYSDQQGTSSLAYHAGKIYSTNYSSGTILENNTTISQQIQPTSISFGDVDNDGDMDYITTSYSKSYLIWYENIDNIYKPHYIQNYSLATDATLEDLDGDGYLDVVVSFEDKNYLAIYEFKETIFVDENNQSVTTIKANDVDGDTLSYSLGGEDKDEFNIDSNGTITFKTQPDFEAPKDSDENNIYHIVVEVTDGSETISKNLKIEVKNLTYFSKKTISLGADEITDIAIKDKNIIVADTQADNLILLSHDNNFSKSTIETEYEYPTYLEVVGNNIVTSFYDGYISTIDSSGDETIVDDDCFDNFSIIKSDIDGDGILDFVANCDTSLKWFKQDSDGSFTKEDIYDLDSYAFSFATLGETHKDIVVSSPEEDAIYKLNNNGSEDFTKEDFSSLVGVGKIVSDGNLTFALSYIQNSITLYHDGVTKVINNPDNINYPDSIEIVDVDKDGKKDLVILTKNDKKLLWYKNLGDDNYQEHLVATFDITPVKSRSVDVDDNGYLDIVVATGKDVYIFYGSGKEDKALAIE